MARTPCKASLLNRESRTASREGPQTRTFSACSLLTIAAIPLKTFMLPSMAYYMGLDAGATKTDCALAEDDTILARAAGGTIKTLQASPREAAENLDALLKNIAAQSGVSLDSITCTCVGLAGYSVPRVLEWARQALRARIGGEILLVGDEEIALDAAFRGGAGVL